MVQEIASPFFHCPSLSSLASVLFKKWCKVYLG